MEGRAGAGDLTVFEARLLRLESFVDSVWLPRLDFLWEFAVPATAVRPRSRRPAEPLERLISPKAFAQFLRAELISFEAKIDERTAHDSYGAREGAHDDLVLALAVAL